MGIPEPDRNKLIGLAGRFMVWSIAPSRKVDDCSFLNNNVKAALAAQMRGVCN